LLARRITDFQVKGLSDGPAQNNQPPPPALATRPPPLKKARPSPCSPTLPPKPAPLVTSHLANRLTQPRPQPAPAVLAKPEPDATESESRESWPGHSEALSAENSADGEEMKVYPDTELQTDDDQFGNESVKIHFFQRLPGRAGEQTRDLFISFIFSFRQFTAEP
jgi:hypothetical protein